MVRADTGSQRPPRQVAGICECCTVLVTSSVNIKQHGQTLTDVGAVHIKIQTVFAVREIFSEHFCMKFQRFTLPAEISMSLRLENVRFPFFWRFWCFKSELSNRWSGERNAKKLADRLERDPRNLRTKSQDLQCLHTLWTLFLA